MSVVPLRRGLVVAALVGAFGAGASCSKVPLVAPSGTAITLVASTNVLPVNGETDITAVLIEGTQSDSGTSSSVTAGGGPPVRNGTLVTFSTTLGTLQPAEAKTTDGSATVKLVGDGRSGAATITAFSGSATKTLTVNIGAAGAALITLTASPQALGATGGHSTVAARVADQQGNGLLGVPVSFSTTAGTLNPTNAITDSTGLATTDLQTTAAATVTATAGGATAALTGTVAITLLPRTTLAVTAPASLMVGVPAVFTITPGGSTIVTSASIDFGDGTSNSLGAISSATTATHIYRSSDEYTVTVTATDSTGQTSSIKTDVAVGPLTATGSAAPSAPTVGSTVVFTVATAANAVVLRYEWDFGDGSSTPPTASGQNSHIYSSSGSFVTTVRVVPFGDGDATTVLIPVSVAP